MKPGNEPTAVPSGIDYLVSLAAGDAKFRERLMSDRLRAAKRAGVRLSESERTLLLAMPDEQLASIIDNTTPRLAPRRSFLHKSMLWAAGLFGGVAMTTTTGCPGPGPEMGQRPHMAPEGGAGDPTPTEPPGATAPDNATPRRGVPPPPKGE
jgi:hypothetical protein